MSESAVSRFACPSCGKSFALRAEHAGRLMNCRGCRATLVIPPPGQSIATRHYVQSAPGASARTSAPTKVVVRGWPPALAKYWPVGIAAAIGLILVALITRALVTPGDGGESVVENEDVDAIGRNGAPPKKKPARNSRPTTPSKADRALVDRWLRDNLDDPNYEVVKWYGPEYAYMPTADDIAGDADFAKALRDLDSSVILGYDVRDYDSRLDALLHGGFDFSSLADCCKALERLILQQNSKRAKVGGKPIQKARVIGLKFRCIQPHGKMLMRMAFRIEQGKATHLPKDQLEFHWNFDFERLFPGEEGLIW